MLTLGKDSCKTLNDLNFCLSSNYFCNFGIKFEEHYDRETFA